MNRRSSSLLRFGPVLPLLCSLCAPLHAEPYAGAPSSDEYAQARALYRRASQAFEGGHYSEARTLLLQAWALRQSYDVAASLGDTELKLGMFAEAAEHLSYSLRNFPPLENEQALANVRRQFEVARQQVAVVHVTVNEPGADVQLDRRAIGTSPLGDAVFVAPGRHFIEARRGSQVTTRELVLPAGTESAVALDLAPAPPAAPRDEPGERSLVPLIVGGAVVAVGLTTGIAFRLSANAHDDHANGIRTRLGQSACAGSAGSSADCTALRDDVDGASRAQALSTTGFVIAGVGAVATPLWWLLTARTKRDTSVGMAAVVMPGLTALSASGRF